MKQIRTLRADEIEVRPGLVKPNGVSLLLYKDARVDMKLLDEIYGPMGWQRKHKLIGNNLYCEIQLYDEKNRAGDRQGFFTDACEKCMGVP